MMSLCSDGFLYGASGAVASGPHQKNVACRKAAPPKKCREASTTVVLNQGSTKSFQGFGGRYPIF